MKFKFYRINLPLYINNYINILDLKINFYIFIHHHRFHHRHHHHLHHHLHHHHHRHHFYHHIYINIIIKLYKNDLLSCIIN